MFTLAQDYTGLGNFEGSSKKFAYMGIGFAIYWWGSDTDFKLIIVKANDFIFAGPGLYIDMQNKGVILPVVKFCFRQKS